MVAEKIKLRRTMMYVSGSSPANIAQATIYGADSLMFDLEDSVSVNEKDAARFVIYHALKTIDFGDTETVVRINAINTETGHQDLEAIVRAKPDVIRLPKTSCAQDVWDAEAMIAKIERNIGFKEGTIKLMAALEDPSGILNAREIAKSSKRLIGMAIGAEDFVTSMKTTRSPLGVELATARGLLLMACREVGIYALDTVYSDINNDEGFLEEVKLIKQLGFDGKSCIHPRQIKPIHQVFTPTIKEIDYAIRTFGAIQEAEEKHSGVIALNGKMIDLPMVERARRVIRLADAAGILDGGAYGC
ncbi:aldolase/citrate lyase family protein [Oscillospiraceae bacterium LTW-04]|nr:aldolase/citrate lyase family protein [Oscillospiraceae bacterium MB24-C1]